METKRIALIGSSGGNLFNQGGNRAETIASELSLQLSAANAELTHFCYVQATQSMDGAKEDVKANLYSFRDNALSNLDYGPLADINKSALKIDEQIALAIQKGEIDGLILLSCDPDYVNKSSIQAAAIRGIPAVGTGGTSMAKVKKAGVRVLCASGTTGTTNKIRALSFASAFAHDWKLSFSPAFDSGECKKNKLLELLSHIKLQGFLMPVLPAYIALALISILTSASENETYEILQQLVSYSIPVVLSALASRQISCLDEIGLITGIVSGFGCLHSGTIGGILAGIIGGIAAYYMTSLALKMQIISTTVSIFSVCFGSVIGFGISYFIMNPIADTIYQWFTISITYFLDNHGILFGAILGASMWFLILKGHYHKIALPLAFIEMGAAGISFIGSVDMISLVMVSAGITLANICISTNVDEKNQAAQGFKLNVLYGTFVEAAYPFMLSNKAVYASAIISAAFGGAIAGYFKVKSTAYIPAFLAPLLANNCFVPYLICMLCTLALAFALVLGINIFYYRHPKNSELKEDL